MSEFGAFKPVSVSVLSFDNSFKTGYSLVLQKQIDSFKSVSFLHIYIDPISTRFWCESYLWPYIDNVLRAGADPGFQVRGGEYVKKSYFFQF